MQQTLILTATTHGAAADISAIIAGDIAMMKIFTPKGSKRLEAQADKQDIADLKHEVEEKLSIYGIHEYKIEIIQEEQIQLKEEIIDIIKKGIEEMGETTPLERLKIIVKLAPELTVVEATPLIEGTKEWKQNSQ